MRPDHPVALVPPARRRRAAGPFLAALALAATLAACGGGATAGGVVTLDQPAASAGPTAQASASIDPEDAMEAFAACMREHGVSIQVAGDLSGGASVEITGQAGVSGGSGATEAQPGTAVSPPEDLAAADEACRHLLPAGGMGDPTATMDPEAMDRMLDFAACMRDHGVDFPDPQFSGGGVTVQVGGSEDGGGIDPMSDAFQAAQAECAKAFPDGAPFVVGGTQAEPAP